MPPDEVMWFIVLLAAIFYVASCFLLRLSCQLANCVGQMGGKNLRVRIPGYGTALLILIAACLIMGLLQSAATEMLSLFDGDYFDGKFFDVLATVASLLIFTLMVSVCLRSEQQTPRSLALLASAIYVIIIFTIIWSCGLLLGSFFT